MSDQAANSPKSNAKEEEVAPLEGEALASAIRKQVEYYFSKENLQQDAYLTSHMDANMSVPLAIIMKFSKMRALSQDEAVIIKALEGSSVSVVDGRIKANVKAGGRSTIILRDIASDANEEEVREIFAYEGSKPIVSIRSEIGDTWFIGMESEEDAKDTLIDLRLKKRTFRGQPVKGRMKTETIVRSFYPVQTAPINFGAMPFGFPGQVGFAYGMIPPNGIPGMIPPPMLSTDNLPTNAGASEGEKASAREDSSSAAGSSTDRAPVSARTGDKKPTSATAPSNTGGKSVAQANPNSARENTSASANNRDRRTNTVAPNGTKSAAGATAAGTPDSKDKKSGSGSRANASGSSSAAKKDGAKSAGVEITPANFPPLAQASQEDTPIPTPGYKTTFLKYSFDEVIQIVKSVQDTTLPETIKPAEHPVSMTTTPNLDLLQRQRTFSIDETREQLRQGKPVAQMAVASSSASDYNTMMYGDGYNSDAGQGGSNIARAKAPVPAPAPAAKKAAGGSWAALVATPAQPGLPAASASGAASSVSGSGTSNAAASSSGAPNTWKRGDKVASSNEKPAAAAGTKSPEKKSEKQAGAAPSEKKKGEKTEKPKKDSKPREEKTEEPQEKAEVPSSWGGKPTFANMLRAAADPEVSSPDAGASSPNPASTPGSANAAKKPASEGASADSGSRKERKGGNEPRGSGKPRESRDREHREHRDREHRDHKEHKEPRGERKGKEGHQ